MEPGGAASTADAAGAGTVFALPCMSMAGAAQLLPGGGEAVKTVKMARRGGGEGSGWAGKGGEPP